MPACVPLFHALVRDQVLSIFNQTGVQWPPALAQLFTILSAFSFNLDLTAPECALKTITYPIKWAFTELLPVFALLAIAVIYVVVLVYKRLCLNARKKGNLHGHLPVVR